MIRADSAQAGFEAEKALDGDPTTLWHTAWGINTPKYPHEIVIGFNNEAAVGGLSITPRQDGNHNGWVKNYAVYASQDGSTWENPIITGSLSADAADKEIVFKQPVTARYLKFVALSPITPGQAYASIAEITILPVNQK